MNRERLRKLALALLNDEDGINENAYIILSELLYSNDCSDILEAVKSTEGRYYLPETHELSV